MKKLSIFLFTLVLSAGAFGQGSYKQPPKAIQEILDAPAIPGASVSPSRDKIALLEPLRYPPISELAEPMLRLAGTRVNPKTNAAHRQPYSIKLTLKDVADGKETAVAFPAGAKIISPQWSPDGKYLAVGNVTPEGVELWIIDTSTAKATKVKNVFVNTAFGEFGWEDSDRILAMLVPSNSLTERKT
jgi:dipeptidyl aminopeptidase/acylaminoacyl peptidase